MNETTGRSFLGNTDPAILIAGAQHAARLAASIAESAMAWAESAQSGLDAAREARAAALLARSVADAARPSEPASALRIVAADAWEAVQRAMDASQRVTRAVAGAYR